MSMDPHGPKPPPTVESGRSALRIALIYALFGFIWIVFSDSILSWFVRDTQQLTSLQTYKGWFYVAVTAWLIFVLVRARLKRIEDLNRSLLEQQDFFRSLIEHSPQAMVVYSPEGVNQHVNERFTELFGYTLADCPSIEAWWPLAYPDPDDRAAVQREWGRNIADALKVGTTAPPFEARVTCKSGEVLDVRFHFRLIGQVAVVTFEDITDIKTMWKERLDLEARLSQSNRLESLGVMAGGIAHDFNNILAAIIGHGEMAQADLTTDSPVRDSVGRVLVAADRARDLVRQILAFSRRAEQAFEPLDIASAVEEAMSLVTATLPSTVEIQMDIAEDAGLVLADRTQINQIVFNLCTNAYHAMTEGDGRLEVRVSPCELPGQGLGATVDLEPGAYVRLDVIDNGSGMDEKTRLRIFEPFFSTKETGQGVGMGLSVVHGVVGSHGGAIAVQSAPSLGTTFAVFLPRQIAGSVTPLPGEAPVPESGHERVLFVDDEPTLADLGRRVLESLGYRAVAETSPTRALDLFTADPGGFDLLVTDQTMPGLSGIELVRACKAITPALPVIICTGFSDVLDETTALEMGASGFLQKPFNREALARTVREALA